MRTRVSVSLNGTELSAVDSHIILHSVVESAAGRNLSGASKGSLFGMTAGVEEVQTKDITITFAVAIRTRDENGLPNRAEVLDNVATWAIGGGTLKVNYREGRHIRVKLAELPSINGIDRWTDDYQIIFRAFDTPCWEEDTANTATINNTTNNSTSILANGNIKTPLCWTALNVSGQICDTVKAVVGGKGISFNSLGLADGETLECDYDDDGRQRFRIKNTGGAYRSVYNKRNAISVDDLWLTPGTNTVEVTAAKRCNFTLSNRGRWI